MNDACGGYRGYFGYQGAGASAVMVSALTIKKLSDQASPAFFGRLGLSLDLDHAQHQPRG
jgi:hypothetical protein